MSSATRLYALLDHTKISDDARGFFNTTVDFRALEIRCWGMRRPPWHLFGVTPGGGSVGHVPFGSISKAKEAAERYFGAAMGEWQETPPGRDDMFVARLLPGYIDWRIGSGPVEREPLFRATLRFAESKRTRGTARSASTSSSSRRIGPRAAKSICSMASRRRRAPGFASPAITH